MQTIGPGRATQVGSLSARERQALALHQIAIRGSSHGF